MRYSVFVILLTSFLFIGCEVEGNSVPAQQAGQKTPEATPTPQATPDAQLIKQFEQIAAKSKGKLGIYAIEIETGREASFNADERFAMQSVVKLPISMAVMKQVSEGKLGLNAPIAFTKEELVPARMHSPMRDQNPNGGEVSLQEMIKAAVSVSDGTAADVLQRVAGGDKGVQAYIDSLGISDMKVRYTHKQFAEAWERQYDNWSTPLAAVQLLRALWAQKAEDPKGSDQKEVLLLTFMYETPTGPNRLKGLLSKDTPVAHKTGTGSTREGVTSATNDVGIITLPNGNHVAIAVFVRDSNGDEKTREAAIAEAAKAVWDKWTKENYPPPAP